MVVAAARDVGAAAAAAGPSLRKITAGGLPRGTVPLLLPLLLLAAVVAAQGDGMRRDGGGGVSRRHDVAAVDTRRANVNVGGINRRQDAVTNQRGSIRDSTNQQNAGHRTEATINYQGIGHRGQEIVNHNGHRVQDSSHDSYHQVSGGQTATAHRSETPRRSASNRGTAAPSPADHRAAGHQSGGHRTSGGGDIVFPDRQFKPRIGATGPGCARGGSFCEDVSDYPGSHVNSVLDNFIQFQEFFGSDVPPPQLSDRISHERTLCESQEKLIFPKMAQNANNEWMYVVNVEGEYKQGIRVELCRSEGNPCPMADRFPAGSHATCKQKYIYRKLVALSENGDPVPDSFRLPSCCACFVEDSVLTGRFAGGRADSNATAERGRR